MSIDKKIRYVNQGGVKNYLGKQKMVKAPLHWQSSPNHPKTELAYITKKEKDLLVKKDLHGSLKGGVNRGPSGIMSLNGWGSYDGPDPSKDTGMSGTATSAAETGSRNIADIRDVQTQMGITNLPPGVMPTGAQDYRNAFIEAATQPRSGGTFFGNIGRGVASIFGGLPGTISSWASKWDPRKLRMIQGQMMPQSYWSEEERQKRRNQASINTILNRDAPITDLTLKRLEQLGYTGEMPGVGSTASSRAIDKDYDINEAISEYPITRNRMQEIQKAMGWDRVDLNDWEGVDSRNYSSTPFHPTQGKGIRSIVDSGYLPGNWTVDPRATDELIDDESIATERFVDLDGIEGQLAFNPGSLLDRAIKNAYTGYKELGIGEDKLKDLMKKDIEQNKKDGTPLSLPPEAYTLIG